MQRHVLDVRLGSGDRRARAVEAGSFVTDVDFVSSNRRLGYGIGDTIDQVRRLGLAPTEVGVDLLLLAAAVYCADTRINRSTESQDRWTREIDIHLPVSAPRKWQSVGSLLQKSLGFLTGDRWRLFFYPRPEPLRSIVCQPPQTRSPRLSSICLFSGGLDSFIGAVDLLVERRDPLLVSHSWVATSSAHQRLCLKALQQQFGVARVRQIRSRIGFPTGLIPDCSEEKTERSRSFLFFAIAALVGSASRKQKTIYVPENGLITLNVPLDPLRIGALSTRTTHPYFIARFNDVLISLGVKTHLENPYRHATKGEMVRRCRNQQLLASSVAKTMSCSSPNKGRYQGHASRHCGYCVPCIIRRAALLGWSGTDPTPYGLDDLRARPISSKKAEGESIRSFQLAVRRLDGSIDRARLLVQEPGPLTDAPDESESFAATYLRGMQEVDGLLDKVVTDPNA